MKKKSVSIIIFILLIHRQSASMEFVRNALSTLKDGLENLQITLQNIQTIPQPTVTAQEMGHTCKFRTAVPLVIGRNNFTSRDFIKSLIDVPIEIYANREEALGNCIVIEVYTAQRMTVFLDDLESLKNGVEHYFVIWLASSQHYTSHKEEAENYNAMHKDIKAFVVETDARRDSILDTHKNRETLTNLGNVIKQLKV